jgi:hypothetical protein
MSAAAWDHQFDGQVCPFGWGMLAGTAKATAVVVDQARLLHRYLVVDYM